MSISHAISNEYNHYHLPRIPDVRERSIFPEYFNLVHFKSTAKFSFFSPTRRNHHFLPPFLFIIRTSFRISIFTVALYLEWLSRLAFGEIEFLPDFVHVSYPTTLSKYQHLMSGVKLIEINITASQFICQNYDGF